MDVEGSLPRSQQPDTVLYPEPDEFSSHSLAHYFFKIHLNIIPDIELELRS
jgi:hypothetical protein